MTRTSNSVVGLKPVSATHLEVVDGRRGALHGSSAVPLTERVLGLGAQDSSRLFLLEVLYQRHGSVGTGQVIPTWRQTHRLNGVFCCSLDEGGRVK